ncbi:MAG: phosphoenolpyruvate synthase [Deltaproteobacteria bacterium]|nr:phosphoenolpyruvate synthase [Deltaproteobacteria bacterium]
MSRLVLRLDEVGRADVALVGGKGANLGELRRLDGVCVPDGFCVTTAAFERVVVAALGAEIVRLGEPSAKDSLAARAAALRAQIEALPLPEALITAISHELHRLGVEGATAVRSSATVEDSAAASFAGQSDTVLNVVGVEAVLRALRAVWASLFTERAVVARQQQGLDAHPARMAVVIQRMLRPQASGVMFTADPVTGHRGRVCVEAVLGLGDAFVSGQAQADRFTVHGAQIIERALVSDSAPALTDAQALRLAALGRRVEAHFGSPQDIEWCLVDDALHLVQSRPITTLFPAPAQVDDGFHVYVSVGHQQMMTDPMRPLGLSLFQATALRPMVSAGGRLFIDVTRELRSPVSRPMVLGALGRSDPLILDALTQVIERGELGEDPPTDGGPPPKPGGPPPSAPIEDDPALVTALMEQDEADLLALQHSIQGKSGAALVEFILEDVARLKRSLLDPQRNAVLMAGFAASAWLNQNLLAWLGEPSAADTLSLSAPNNVTTEMGLALMEVADVIRPFPEVVQHLQTTTDERFWRGLLTLDGGPQAHAALSGFLVRYGARCVGEIDLCRPRWAESPTAFVPLLLSNLQNAQVGDAERRAERGRQAAAQKTAELLARLRQLPEGEQKAQETAAMISRLRTFTGYREHPKYSIVRRYWVYKQALLQEIVGLVAAGVLSAQDDAFYLSLDELGEVIQTQRVDAALLKRRRAEHEHHQRLTPPRVLTSNGECVAGAYRRGPLNGALVGLPVSVGVVEGRARVLRALGDSTIEAGDILVTPFTDPSWTPLFVHLKALITEVGGLMTHGAVIARELGVPAVVGVVGATRRIRDGQRVRVDGTAGTVELLD